MEVELPILRVFWIFDVSECLGEGVVMMGIGPVKFLFIASVQAFYLIILLVLRDCLASRCVWLRPERKAEKVALALVYMVPTVIIGLATKTLLMEALCGICGWLFVVLLKAIAVRRNEY